MDSPLGSVIATIFMVELETTLVSRLKHHVQKWRRFVDDMFEYIKVGSAKYVLPVPRRAILFRRNWNENSWKIS